MSDAATPPYVELACATHFSFLHGANHGGDLIGRAIELGHAGLGICDRNTVAGVVRAWDALGRAAKGCHETLGVPPPDFRLVTGARLVFADGTPDIIAYPEDRAGWGRLTRLLSKGNLRSDKGDCVLELDDLLAHSDGLLLIVLPESSRRADEGIARPEEKRTVLPEETAPLAVRPGPLVPLPEAKGDARESAAILPFPARPPMSFRDPGTGPGPGPETCAERSAGARPPASAGATVATVIRSLRAAAPGRVWLGAALRVAGDDRRRLARLVRMGKQADVPLVALNDALYARPDDRPLQDVLTCIRLGVTVEAAGRALHANGERHLKSPAVMADLFRDHPEALAETMRLFARIRFDLADLAYEYPHEPVPPGWRPMRWLQHRTVAEARKKWPNGTTRQVRDLLREEFRLIRKRDYAYYFLTVHDLVQFARDQKPPILCQGRGSAANSMVCYLLGVTAVDPAAHNLLFSRFLSAERDEPPDIDVDFEHERREEVMQYVYRRYGRHRAGIVATVIHYRSRSAVREAGKALGLSEDVTTRLVSTVWGSYATEMAKERFHETGFDLADPQIARLNHFVGLLLRAPFPRHLSQHVGGFVLTEGRLDETVPLHHAAMEGRTFIEWDKDDIDALGLMKVDVLSLGMLTCIRKAFDLIRDHEGDDYSLATLPPEQEDVYAMLQQGDSIGVFQVESRAQMNMLPRLRPREFYDLVVQVAIVRPGPIQGDMVHPYLRRRAGLEQAEFPAPDPAHGPADELHQLLGKTYGVPLFQEQAMKLAIVAACFTPDEANQLRRAMATFRHVGGMDNFKAKLVGGMTGRGYTRDFAERCYKQIEGFGSYGFPESHALSFALLVYASAYVKCRHPAAFCAGLLNAQPMGFYAPAQIVRDAREHGVEVREIDVAHSLWDNKLEPSARPNEPAVRLGFRQIDGFREEWGKAIAQARAAAPFTTVEGLARAATLPSRALRLLADADAFRALGLDRRQALWEVRRTPAAALPLFAAAGARELGAEADPALPAMPLSGHVAADYQTTRLSLKDHPMTFLRPLFAGERVRRCADLRGLRDGARAKVAGVVLVRQRPGEGKAIFITLEDESGVANVLMWARDFERHRRAVMASRLLEAHGIVQKSREGVVHLMCPRVVDRTAELSRLSEDHPARLVLARADTFEHPQHPRHPGGIMRHPRDVRILPASRDFH